MAAIINSEDLFDFEKYRRELTSTEQAATAWAQATEVSAARVKASYDAAQAEIQQLTVRLNGINLGAKNGVEGLSTLGDEVVKVTKKTAEYRQRLVDLKTAEDAHKNSVNDLGKMLGILEADYKKLDPTQASFKQQQTDIAGKVKLLSTTITTYTSVLKEAKKSTDAAENSYNKLSRQTNDLRTALRQMPGAFDLTTGAINKTNRAAVDLQQQIDRNAKALLRADQQMGQSQRQVGAYGTALNGLKGFAMGAATSVLGIGTALDAITALIKVTADMERLDTGLKAVSRDSDDFKRSQEFLINTADELGVEYSSLVKSYKLLKAATKDTVLEGKNTENIFHAITEAGSRLQLSTEETEGALNALSQMISKGHIQAEELRGQLGDRLPGALRIMAEATGVSTEALDKMMKDGQLLAVDVLPKFAAQLDKIYGGDAQGEIHTMSAEWNRLTNEAKLFVATMNEDKAVSGFFGTVSAGIRNVIKDLRLAVKDGAWVDFFTQFVPGLSDQHSITQRRQKYDERATFSNMSREQRHDRLQTYDDLASGKTTAPDMSAAEAKKRASDLRKLNRELYIAEDKQDAQTRLNQEKADDAKSLAAKLARMKESSLKVRQQEIADTKQRIADTQKDVVQFAGGDKEVTEARKKQIEADKQYLAGLKALNAELAKKDAKQGAKDAKSAEAEAKRAKAEAERLKNEKLQNDLGKAKAGTTTSLEGNESDKSSGIIDELTFIERRKQITVQGIEERRALLKKAGKDQTDDYKQLTAELARADSDYNKDKIRIEEAAFKKQLEDTKAALGEISRVTQEELTANLDQLERNYVQQEGQIRLAVAERKITEAQGDQQINALKAQYLSDQMQAVESAYQKDQALSTELVEQKIKDLNEWKAAAIRTPAEILAAEITINNLRKALETGTAEDRKKALKALADFEVQTDQNTNDKKIKAAAKAESERQALINQGFQTAQAIGQAIGDVVQNNSQHELDVLSQQKERELALAGDNADAKTKIEQDYARQESEIRRKQAVAQRTAALFNIAISTAQAVMSVLSTGGGAHYLDFGVSAGILSAFVTAAGLAQAAAVIAAPLPAYKDGKKASNPYTGKALAGEAGAELLVDREGSARLLDRPTIIDTRAGDTIFTASETARIAADWHRQEIAQRLAQEAVLNQRTTSALHTGRQNEIRFIMSEAARPGLSKKDMSEAFGQALDNRPQHITNIDEDGFHYIIKEGHSQTEYLNKRFRLG